MEIRLVTNDDALAIKNLIHELGYDTPTNDIVSRIELYNDSEGAYVFVAEVEDRVAGLVVGYVTPYFHRSGQMLRIVALVVAEKSRKMGVASALYDIIEKVARERACDRIEVTTGGYPERSVLVGMA